MTHNPSAPFITLEALQDFSPCEAVMHRLSLPAGEPITAEMARQHGATLEDMLWVALKLERTNADVRRRMLLWAADCAAHVAHLCSDDPRPAAAIAATRRFARGEISEREWMAAGRAAQAFALEPYGAPAWPPTRSAAVNAAWAAYWDNAREAAEDAARAVIAAARSEKQHSTARSEAYAAEKAWQFDRFVARMSNDEPDDWPTSMPLKEETTQ